MIKLSNPRAREIREATHFQVSRFNVSSSFSSSSFSARIRQACNRISPDVRHFRSEAELGQRTGNRLFCPCVITRRRRRRQGRNGRDFIYPGESISVDDVRIIVGCPMLRSRTRHKHTVSHGFAHGRRLCAPRVSSRKTVAYCLTRVL